MFYKYPYTNLYNLNLDWIIQAIKEMQEIVEPLDRVVNSVNGMTGDVEITKAMITQILGNLVETFNGRSGAVQLTADDVNATLIDIVWTSDPGDTIQDLTQTELDEMYMSGKRILIFVSNIEVADQVYFLQWYDDHAQPQEYTPTSALAGVASFNGMTGNVVATGDDIKTSATDTKTIAESLAEKVPVTRTVNGQQLSRNVNLDADDIPSQAIQGAITVEMGLLNLQNSKVPNVRTVNGKQLLNDIELNDEDIPSTVDGKQNVQEVLEDHSERIADVEENKADIILSSASGPVASFDDGADGLPVESLTVEIDPVQEGTGDPSPDNVRPITGWTGAKVVVSPTTDEEDGTTYNITFPTEAGTVYGGTLTVNDDGSGALEVNVFKYRVPRNPSISISNASYIKSDACNAYITLSPAVYPGASLPNIQYNINKCSIFKMINVRIWGQTGYPNCCTINLNQLHLNIANDLLGIVDYTQETMSSVRQKIINYLNSLYDAGKYVEVTYKIEPTTYTLTPTEITTLLGINNIWADTGDVNVSYRADTKRYIDNVDEYLQIKSLSCSSLVDLKSELLRVANSLANDRATYITFYVSGDTTGFNTGDNYAGTLYIEYKSGTDLVFSALVTSKDAHVISIGYNFGVWSFKNLDDNIIFRDYNFQNITSSTDGEMITTAINVAVSGYQPLATTILATWDETQWIHTCMVSSDKTQATVKSYHIGTTSSTISGFLRVAYIKV